MRKKIFCLLMSIVMVATFMPAMTFASFAGDTLDKTYVRATPKTDDNVPYIMVVENSSQYYMVTSTVEGNGLKTRKLENTEIDETGTTITGLNFDTWYIQDPQNNSVYKIATSDKTKRIKTSSDKKLVLESVSGDSSGSGFSYEGYVIKGTSSTTSKNGPLTYSSGIVLNDNSKASTPDKVYFYREASSGEVGDDVAKDTLAFTSDIHSRIVSDSSPSLARLGKWIDNVASAEKDKFELMGTCGDNADAQVSENNYWEYSTDVFNKINNSANTIYDGFFVAGNHEWNPGNFGQTRNTAKNNIKTIGSKYTADSDYVLYGFGAAQYNQEYKNTADITALGTYLKTAPNDRPIFIMGHFPLHSDSGRSTENAEAVVDTINANAEGKTIIFMWGHTHTVGDTNYDKIYKPGATISGKTLNFNYCAAGCMCGSEYDNGANNAAIKGKGIVASIDTANKNKVTLQYYDENGTKQGDSVVAEESKTVEVESVTVSGASDEMEVGSTLQLSATVLPTEANQEVTWTSSNGTYATVSSTGLVTAVSEGNVTITATSKADGTKSGTYEITVKPKAPITYYKTSNPTTGKSYAMVLNDGSKYYEITDAVSGAGFTAKEITVSSDSFSSTDATIWTIGTAYDGWNFKNSAGKFIKSNKDSVATNGGHLELSTGDSGFSYDKTNNTLKATSDTEGKKGYFVLADNVVRLTPDTATADQASKIYFFSTTKDPEPIHVTGVELDKESDEIVVGKSVTLHATVTPANADDPSVTWESSYPTVATVSNGVVTGIKAGETTITVKTVDGSFTDECSITVTEPAKKTYQLVSGDYVRTTAEGTTNPGYVMVVKSGDAYYIVGHEESGNGMAAIQVDAPANGRINTADGDDNLWYVLKDSRTAAGGTETVYKFAINSTATTQSSGTNLKYNETDKVDISNTGSQWTYVGNQIKIDKPDANTWRYMSYAGNNTITTSTSQTSDEVYFFTENGEPEPPHDHEGVLVPLKRATFTADGQKAYYECSCGKHFKDKACTEEITDMTTLVIPKVSTAKISATNFYYNGKYQKPSVTVKNRLGEAVTYKLTNAGIKSMGKGSVKIVLTGNYSGTKTFTYKMNPKGASLSKLTKGKKKITVKWNKQSSKMASKRITGYQIQIALNSKFTSGAKAYKVKGYKKTSKTIKKLKAKKRYYVRVRTYYGSYYSKWSKVKYIKTK